MSKRKTVLLYSPHYVAAAARNGRGYLAVPPLSLLAIAGPLRDAGYNVRILDAKWDYDWRDQVRAIADELLCVGVTALTGPAVADGLEFADFVREVRPDAPIVWGGWHATFAAQHAMEDARVDVVVRGMGERSFVDVVRAIDADDGLQAIPGINFRDGSRIVATPDRPAEDINNFPPPAYDLIRPERYILEAPGGVRQASAIFSRGCPFSCDFCLDSRNAWIGLSIDRMLTDIEFWLARGANRIQFYDGNFFLGRARLIEFCDAIRKRDLHTRFQWIATAVGRRVAKMDDELLAKLKQAGLAQVAIGAESGSEDLLSRITNKTTVETTLEAVRRLTKHGINQYLFFMVGYPDEPPDALERTLDFVMQLKRINPDVTLNLNYVTPLPGSEVYRIAVGRGLVEAPKNFADWARFDYLQSNLIGVDDNYSHRVKRFQQYLNVAYPLPGTRVRPPRAVRRLAEWRLDTRRFGWPVELRLMSALRSVAASR